MNEELLRRIQVKLAGARRVLAVSHIRPDGDAVGSLLGFGLSLQQSGRDVQMVLADGLPVNFRHLPGSNQVRTQAEGTFDLIVVLDCSDLRRVGGALNGYSIPDVNIDHHPTNLNFATINIVKTEAVATAEILADYLPKLGLPVSKAVATALLNGLVADTLGFRTKNMTPEALRAAADFMELGANLPELYHRALLTRSYEAARYWGAGLSQLQREDRMVWTSLSMADRRAVGYSGGDDADLINHLSTLNDVDVVILFVEQANHKVKVSWRAQPNFDVSQVAVQFGGGGHKAAAGAELQGTLEGVQEPVLQATRQILFGAND